ncbi:MAG: hypothetical protein ACE5MG_12650, partial [Candidatus Methylomirabilales bacterium]
ARPGISDPQTRFRRVQAHLPSPSRPNGWRQATGPVGHEAWSEGPTVVLPGEGHPARRFFSPRRCSRDGGNQ